MIITINDISVDVSPVEIPHSECAMHCKIAGRIDYIAFITNGRYCYVKFADNTTCHGLLE